MKKNSFRLSALTVSVIVGLSSAAYAAGVTPAVKDITALSHNTQNHYSGGGAVFIGGDNLTVVNNTLTGSRWVNINPDTPGFEALLNSSGYKGYMDANAASLSGDVNYLIDEDYQRALHGQRQVHAAHKNGYSAPVGVVNGLKMGTASNRYQKTQSVTLYQRDAAGAIKYQKNADGTFALDKTGKKIPLTVTASLALDRNSDVYIKPITNAGGNFGLADAAIYSKVVSLQNDVTAAVSVNGNLQENSGNQRARDVLIVKNTTIDNTLDKDSVRVGASGANGDLHGNEHVFNERPFATGLSINSSSINHQFDQNGQTVSSGVLTHQVAKTANVVLDNAQITAKNIAAVRHDDNNNGGYRNYTSYDRYADNSSTAVAITGSGLFVSIGNKSTLTGGVNHAGNALSLSGHANRVDVNNSTLNGDVQLNHDGYRPTITVNVVRDSKTGHYVANGAAVANSHLLDRHHNGTTLNIANNSVVNGDITASGQTGYSVQLIDVTANNSPVTLSEADITGSTSATAIYKNAVSSANQTLLANAGAAWTPVTVNLNHSTLNGRVAGITSVAQPDFIVGGTNVLSWHPDLNVKSGAVWNAAATADGGLAISDVHDLNLSASTLNMINLETDHATLGGRGRYEDVGAARVVVHGNLSQDKDSKGNNLTSLINIGKAVVDPLMNLGGAYTFGSIQVKGSAQGSYKLDIANSGVEPYVKQGYIAARGDVNSASRYNPHSFVNYQNSGSNAHFYGRTEMGIWQYDAVDVFNDTVHNERNVYFKNNGHLSNSAATALSMAASQVNIASMENDALTQHLKAARHAEDDGGVWLSYFGGKNKNTTSAGAAYKLDTHGVMLGVDNRFDAKDGSWLAGVAFSSARSDLSVMNSSGDLDSYGAQFYLSRQFSNGVFVDTAAQFDHFSNSGDVRMLDGQRSRSNFSTNGYGLGMTVGYAWADQGFFAEPYAKVTGRTIDGAHYTMNNGMVVSSDDYKSLQGEIGADVGYTFEINQGYIKPYFHLAGLNEFADSNEVKLNNVNLNNSIDGAAVRVGAGAEVKLMKDIGGYASFNYTKGDDIERPWQANVGLNYSW
ncbi:autotransporter outer membrane beta-barrel domain-containing protein [Erwinia sorbitola]|uniref:Autotransporter outer membrane beta-barrel domain-containing protein n=1 Tax=Erwinia sorbitola TaxID=2681984 RepID=A0A6I6EL78_9GAMM|nr:autotransporter outer membrane beta-barrel domain-containing protein [Erwinia sorbitola]MTD28075.1 autotransporter outer membrane beta-barrel domain-containing protein [Erwinia sorbitola]QGU85769.1 autotransporter outer membrane beta-barrel domain-containing protein [Erwinia sorbitola]